MLSPKIFAKMVSARSGGSVVEHPPSMPKAMPEPHQKEKKRGKEKKNGLHKCVMKTNRLAE